MRLVPSFRRQKRWMLLVTLGTVCQLGCWSSTQWVDFTRSAIALLSADVVTQFATTPVRNVFPDPQAN
jgi:dolichyl-phosphate-mannose--protein O-mannosyl transferase